MYLGMIALQKAVGTPAVGNMTSVTYIANFSEAVANFTTADFVLSTTGSLQGGSVASVASMHGSPTNYLVTVNTPVGEGDLRLIFSPETVTDTSGSLLKYQIQMLGGNKIPFAASNMHDAAFADLDGDGRSDLIISLSTNMNYQLKAGSFSIPAMLGNSLSSLDINGDGRPDILASLVTGTQIATLISGAWTPNYIDLGVSARMLEGGDMTGDRQADFAFTDANSANVLVRVNGTGGNLSAVLPGKAEAMAVADVTGDGLADVITGSTTGGGWLAVHSVTAGGTQLTQKALLSVPGGVRDIVVANVDGLPGLDIVAANGGVNDGVTIFHNNGVGGFTPERVGTGTVTAVAAYDMNGDGRTDIIMAGPGASTADQITVSILFKNALGTYDAPKAYTSGIFGTPVEIEVGDAQGNGLPDLLMSATSAQGTSVYEFDTYPTAGTLTSMPIHIDRVAPTTPSISPLGATMDHQPILSGLGEANSTVRVMDGNLSVGTARVDGTGHWAVKAASALADGLHTLTAYAADDYGNVSALSGGASLQIGSSTVALVDSVTPVSPISPPPPATPGQTFNGTSGYDTLDLSSMGRRGGSFFHDANGNVTFTHNGVVDILKSIEAVKFADGVMKFDLNDTSAQVVRLYQAALGREPDQPGLNYWINEIGHGKSLQDLAKDFTGSDEFATRYGAHPSTGNLVELLYNNTLHRASEAAGKSYWMTELDQGHQSKDQVLIGFSESAENKANTASFVMNGIWDLNENAATVARLYEAVLGRAPDINGLTYWTNKLESGAETLKSMTGGFTGSIEFTARYGAGISTDSFVELLYNNSLHRVSDPHGKVDWVNGVNSAAITKADVVLGFSESAEHIQMTNEAIMSNAPEHYGIIFT